MITIRGSGLTTTGFADRRHQRGVVHAVGVEPAVGQVDALLCGPRADRFELARRPHERPGERAVVGVAVVAHAVAGGDHGIEPEPVGERLDEVVRRGGGQHQRPPRLTMHGEQLGGEGLHHRHEPVGDAVGRSEHRRPRAALREPDRLARQRHRRQGLADGVETASRGTSRRGSTG